MAGNNSEVIDLCTPVNETAPADMITNSLSQVSLITATGAEAAATTVLKQTPYKSRTLTANSERYSILPAFPATFENKRPYLLLANVPGKSSNSRSSISRNLESIT